SASAVTTAVFIPNVLRSPRATLYSPPPSHTRNWRAVLTRTSPGSRRSITSPRLTRSQRHPSLARIFMQVPFAQQSRLVAKATAERAGPRKSKRPRQPRPRRRQRETPHSNQIARQETALEKR